MRLVLSLILALMMAACVSQEAGQPATSAPDEAGQAPASRPAGQPAAASEDEFRPAPDDPLRDVRELRLRNVRQLTFGGENAEAYFSPDSKRLVLQRRELREGCDQIYVMDLESGDMQLVSTGEGRTTCAYFYPDGEQVIYASTHGASPECPDPPPFKQGRYVWPVFDSYDLWLVDLASGTQRQLTDRPGYDAEATLAPDGSRVVFTSTRDGDLELYTMKLDGSDVKRVTDRPGYDGGAFFSPDSQRLVWRASYPEGEELAVYQELLSQGLVEPGKLEIWVADADGSNATQVTSHDAASFCPFFTPEGDEIIYSSNRLDERGRSFDLFLVSVDGERHERVTFHPDFDGFPMFSPDGSKLVWGSNRNAEKRGETNIFIADWVARPEPGQAP